MLEIYKQFTKSIAWDTFEAASYQLLLLCHQIALFSIIGRTEYGLIGALFSIIYLVVTITNFGLDVTLSPFFSYMTTSKQHFKRVMCLQFLPELMLLLCMGLLGLLFQKYTVQSWLHAHALSPYLLVIFTGIIFFESAKKTVRTLLQLA